PIKTPGPGFDGSVFLEVWDPGGAQPPNSHPSSVETFFILEGSGVAYSDADEFPVAVGGFVVLPAGTVHRIVNTGTTRLYAVTTMQPDAGFAALVEAGVPELIDESDRRWVGTAAAQTPVS
ncbi:MAG: Cupin 2 conserved barrel domain protein, partial [Acidimicrobiaceae bacterium]|nr:Cupin 2 conserved barrel domain protein [Acidimicrobiaceae bacterium]